MSIKNNLYYRLVGSSGPPIVFIHGIMGFWRNFYSISQAFKQDYTSLLYDQRGHGRSFHKEPYTVEQLVWDLKELLDHLKWHNVHLVGHSLGGYVSYLLASQFPEYVKKLVIVDSNPWPQPQMGEYIRKLILNLPESFDDRGKAKEFFKHSVEKQVFSKDVANLLWANLEINDEGPVKFLFDAPGILKALSSVRSQKLDYPSMLNSLKIQMLILRGEHSTYFLKSDFKKTLKLNPLITGKEIKNSSHWLHFEQPQAFINSLREFLD